MSNIQKSPSNPMPPALAKELIESQNKQLDLSFKQLEFQKEVQQNNLEYAKMALHERMNSQTQQSQLAVTFSKWKYLFSGFVIIILFLIVLFALHLQQIQFAEEIIKTVASLTVGAIGGYGYATISHIKEKEKK